MMKRFSIILMLLLLCASSSYAFVLNSMSGTASDNAIIGSDVLLQYETDYGTAKTATNNVATINVTAIYGYDPSWAAPPTFGMEPAESATYSYQIKNVGNHSDTFTVTFSATQYYLSDASSWNITVSTTSIMLTQDEASAVFDLVVTASPQVTPGAYVAVSLNIECDSNKQATPYTGDNGNPYGGYGDSDQISTTSILLAVMDMTKTVTINTPADYTGGSGKAVPGAKLTYTLNWENRGSLYASNVQIIDLLPTTNTVLTGNAVPTSSIPLTPTVSYYWNNAWNLIPSSSASEIKIEYGTVPASTTGNITYDLIIK